MHIHETLALAHDHGRRLRADAAAERLLAPSQHRRSLAASLRRISDRLDPGPLARTPASSH